MTRAAALTLACLALAACAHTSSSREPASAAAPAPRGEPLPAERQLIAGEREPVFPPAYCAKFFAAGRRTPAVLFKVCVGPDGVPTEITPAGDRTRPAPMGLDVVYPDEMEPAFREYYLAKLGAWRFPPRPPDAKPCTAVVLRYRLDSP